MKQMQMNPDQLINIDYKGAAHALEPIIFKEGDSFCCLLGPDPQLGVIGCGSTPEDAVQDWDNNLAEHLSHAKSDDLIVRHVKYVLDRLNDSIDQETRLGSNALYS